MNIFQRRESEVRSYIRTFPVWFEKARGCHVFDREGQAHSDFFARAGALNYGHNPEAWVQRHNVSFLPYDGYVGPDVDTAALLRKLLTDKSSGVDLPAAVVLETIQAEGGVNVASKRWLQDVAEICRENDVLLVVDDI